VPNPDYLLMPDKCLTSIPTDLMTWAQPSISASQDVPGRWWIRVYRKSGRASPPERTILTFWSHDQDFAEFLRLFARRAPQALKEGISVAATPDISICWDDSRAMAHRLYAAQTYYGRKMQDFGLQILPNVPLLHPDYAEEMYRTYVPREVPLAAQIQTALRPYCDTRDKDGLKLSVECLETIIGTTNAPQMLLYGSKRIFEAMTARFSRPSLLRHVHNISDLLNLHALVKFEERFT
jgi:hypothetical protein